MPLLNINTRSLDHGMRFGCFITSLILLSGCSVEHGQVDFVSAPLFQLRLGDYTSFLFFSDSTVLRMGGPYYTLLVPLWILIALAVGCVAFFAVWIIYRRHGKGVV